MATQQVQQRAAGGIAYYADAAAGAQYQSARPGGRLGRGQCIGAGTGRLCGRFCGGPRRLGARRPAARRRTARAGGRTAGSAAESRGTGPYAGAVLGHTIRSLQRYARAGRCPKLPCATCTPAGSSCSLRTGTLAFAQRLCVMPPAAQEYVVVHEFCHFAHPNHSPAFGRRWKKSCRITGSGKSC